MVGNAEYKGFAKNLDTAISAILDIKTDRG